MATTTDPPPSFFCPISSELMRDPVTSVDGHCYERSFIERWFAEKATSPLTGAALASTDVTPNHALRNEIEEWEETHCKTIARGALSPALFNAATLIGVGSFKEVHKATLSVPGAQTPTAVAVMRVRDGNVDAEAAMLLRDEAAARGAQADAEQEPGASSEA